MVTVTVVSFVTPSLGDAVASRLQNLGYRVAPLPGPDWLQAAGNDRDGVLALILDPRPEQRWEAIRDALVRSSSPRLGIFPGDYPRDRATLDQFKEFLAWPCRARELDLRLQRLLPARPAPAASRLPASLAPHLIGESPVFLAAVRSVERIAHCDAEVLIEGETGTGKEVVARAIHYLGPRKGQPFIPVNCGALPDELVENELFGHQRGAYTDARTDQPGLVEQAEGGTLFLDEVEALSPKGQVALLRFLQNHEYRPLGGQGLRQADVRVICASNASLETLVREGRFRMDLYYRINLLPIELPPLRERGTDVALLAEYFLERCRRQYHQPDFYFHPEALTRLHDHPWPGNVRELENAVHRAFLLAEGPAIHLPRPGEASPPASAECPGFSTAKARAIETFERRYLQALMSRTGGNVTAAARLAGKERRALGKLLKKHGIGTEARRGAPAAGQE